MLRGAPEQREAAPALGGADPGVAPPAAQNGHGPGGAARCLTPECGNLGNPGTYDGLCLQCWQGTASLPKLGPAAGRLPSGADLPRRLLQLSGQPVGTPAMARRTDSTPWSRSPPPNSPGGAQSTEAASPQAPSTPPLAETWPCLTCTFTNPLAAIECQMCQGGRPWHCPDCSTENPGGKTAPEKCKSCSGMRPWVCTQCTVVNRLPASVCGTCEWRAPAGRLPPPPPPQPRTGGLDGSLLGLLSEQQRQELLQDTGAERERNQGIKQGRPRLDKRLQQLSCTELPMPDDGNCLFRAVSLQLWNSQRQHEQLRQAVVNHIRGNMSEYGSLFLDDAELDSYLQRMARSGSWGDEVCLRAAADLLGVSIHVVQSTEGSWYLCYEPQGSAEGQGGAERHVFLSYLAPVHYNGVVPSSDDAAAALHRTDQAAAQLAELRLHYDGIRATAEQATAEKGSLDSLERQAAALAESVGQLPADKGAAEVADGARELERLVRRLRGSAAGAAAAAERPAAVEPCAAGPDTPQPAAGEPEARPAEAQPQPAAAERAPSREAPARAATPPPAGGPRSPAARSPAAPARQPSPEAPAAAAPAAAAPALQGTHAEPTPPRQLASPEQPSASPPPVPPPAAVPPPLPLPRFKWLRLVPVAVRRPGAGCELAGIEIFETGAAPGAPLAIRSVTNPGGRCAVQEGPGCLAQVQTAGARRVWCDRNQKALLLELGHPAAPATYRLRCGGSKERDMVAWRLEGSRESQAGPWQLLHEHRRASAKVPGRWAWSQHWALPQPPAALGRLSSPASGVAQLRGSMSLASCHSSAAAPAAPGRWEPALPPQLSARKRHRDPRGAGVVSPDTGPRQRRAPAPGNSHPHKPLRATSPPARRPGPQRATSLTQPGPLARGPPLHGQSAPAAPAAGAAAKKAAAAAPAAPRPPMRSRSAGPSSGRVAARSSSTQRCRPPQGTRTTTPLRCAPRASSALCY
eukprot:TRINITY_DN4573_c3_g1_i1.p1 TRINITY_DN4573_c3_g1~~TRINITY_DN4573_c3_g1_i1.p1  ORF type:complete len:1000 (+),score=170.64 TRINITY_DN4573_c3_g1_i1:82-3000(+)